MSPEEQLLCGYAEQLGKLLMQFGHRLAVAESCTGGWMCQCVTAIPGSSAWFDRGFVTYSNDAKVQMLGVPEVLLLSEGAVSEATVRAMVTGVLQHSPADCAIAVSGIAGPAGAVPGKPVGTVWLAWQRRGEETCSRCEHFAGDREAVRRQAVIAGLQGMSALYGRG